jgi:hypothetical protein
MIDWAKIMPPDTARATSDEQRECLILAKWKKQRRTASRENWRGGGGAAKPLRADKDRISREFSGTSCCRAVGHGLVETQEGKRH